MISESAENYLKAIFKLGGEESWVATGDIARRVGVSAPSVSRMLRKLDERRWVDHNAYQGVRLTEEGLRHALRVVRSHRILETYLAEVLGMPWDRVDAEVERLEHVVSEELVNRLEEALGFPRQDPHGSPIPDREGRFPAAGGSGPLLEAEEGIDLVVTRVEGAAPGALQYLASRGIVPGARIRLLRREPYDGPLILEGEGEGMEEGGRSAIGRSLAARIHVRPSTASRDEHP